MYQTTRPLTRSERVSTSRVYAGRSWIDPVGFEAFGKVPPRTSDHHRHAVTVIEPKREGSIITLADGRQIVRPIPRKVK